MAEAVSKLGVLEGGRWCGFGRSEAFDSGVWRSKQAQVRKLRAPAAKRSGVCRGRAEEALTG